MTIEGLMKRGKSVGSDDPAAVLAKAIYDLQSEVKRLTERVEALESNQGRPLMIGSN